MKKEVKFITKVTNIKLFGTFCELKNAAGLTHINEISNYYAKDTKKFVNIDDDVEVDVLCYDQIKKQVKLSYKNYWS